MSSSNTQPRQQVSPEAQAQAEFAEVADQCRQKVGEANEVNQRNDRLREQILEKIRKRESLKQDMLDMQKYAQAKAEIAKCRIKHDEMVQRFAELEAKKFRRRDVLAKIEELAGRSVTMNHERPAPSCCDWPSTRTGPEQAANDDKNADSNSEEITEEEQR